MIGASTEVGEEKKSEIRKTGGGTHTFLLQSLESQLGFPLRCFKIKVPPAIYE